MEPLIAVVDYSKKELALVTTTQKHKWNLNDGDVGDFWHTFTDENNVIWDINFYQEDETQKPSFAIYPVKAVIRDGETVYEVDTTSYELVDVAKFGNPKDYFI